VGSKVENLEYMLLQISLRAKFKTFSRFQWHETSGTPRYMTIVYVLVLTFALEM
jgi:hypothetical protein